jgi:hypothetical protein
VDESKNGCGTYYKEVENYVDVVNGKWTRHLVMYQVYVCRIVALVVAGHIKKTALVVGKNSARGSCP